MVQQSEYLEAIGEGVCTISKDNDRKPWEYLVV